MTRNKTIVEVGSFHVPWRIQGQPQQLLQDVEEPRHSQERNADHEFTDAVKKWKAIPKEILTVDPPSTKNGVIALMEQLTYHVNAAMEISEKLVEAKRRRVERVEEMLKEEGDIDALLESKMSRLGAQIRDNDLNSMEEKKVLLGHILDLIDY